MYRYKFYLEYSILIAGLLLCLAAAALAQPMSGNNGNSEIKSQEVSDSDGVPVLMKHLPDWENVRAKAVFANNAADLKKNVGERPLLDLIDFAGGTEAVSAQYDAGRLVIVEFTTPQASTETDQQIKQRLTELNDPSIVYRRIGNYNAVVYDVADADAANALLDRVKFQKDVQWLFGAPARATRAERDFTVGAANLFLSTALAILLAIGFAMAIGVLVGIIYFKYRERERITWGSFSDAGGMVRLNLDGLSADSTVDHLLSDSI